MQHSTPVLFESFRSEEGDWISISVEGNLVVTERRSSEGVLLEEKRDEMYTPNQADRHAAKLVEKYLHEGYALASR